MNEFQFKCKSFIVVLQQTVVTMLFPFPICKTSKNGKRDFWPIL